MSAVHRFPPLLSYTDSKDSAPYEAWRDSFRLKVPSKFNFAYDVLGAIASDRPGATALVTCDDQGNSRSYTFGEIEQASNRAAAFFLRRGLRKGDAVLLLLRRRPEFWFALLGLHKIGAVAVPGTHLLTAKDIAFRVKAADIRMIVAVDSPFLRDHISEAEELIEPGVILKALVHDENATMDGGWVSFNRGIDAESGVFSKPRDTDLPGPKDPMLVYFTSGTTGHPKMVMHDFLYPLGHIVTAKYWQQVKIGGLHLTLADTGWAKAAWGKIYGQWFAGCAVLAYDFDRFNPRKLLDVIQEHGVTSFCAPPTVYRFLIRENLKSWNLSALEHCTVAGEPLNPEVFDAFLRGTGIKLMEAYGQTELTPVIGTFRGVEPRPGSMGKPAPLWDVCLLDDSGNECAPGTPGQIALRIAKQPPPGFMMITNNPGHHCASAALVDGIYYTGDIARKDEDGYFWFIGRNDDIIKSSGYRIGPFEVESALIEHPAVVECAVTGIPDPDRGNAVKATVVLANGFKGSPELATELQDFVKTSTAPYKSPRVIEFVKELPKTISGKIRRVEIRASTS